MRKKRTSSRKLQKPFGRENKAREDRILMKIVVDAYNESERAMGWYCYLESVLEFPFEAVCVGERQVSPMGEGETVEVIGMADSEECCAEMFVLVESEDDEEAVPLAQLWVKRGGGNTKRAVEDWHYWVARGYRF
jgi:hypothetical protein